MPSFDIVSKVEAQALDNAVNVTSKEITNQLVSPYPMAHLQRGVLGFFR